VEHYDLPTAQEEDIFKRIQQGMTLVTGGKDRPSFMTTSDHFIREVQRWQRSQTALRERAD
jgi:hypothetical protein